MPGSVSLCLYFQPETDERLAHDLLVRGFEFGQGRAGNASVQPDHVRRRLRGDGVHLHEHRVDDGQHPVLNLVRRRQIARLYEVIQRLRLLRNNVGGYGDKPRPADGEDGQVQVVVARIQVALAADAPRRFADLLHAMRSMVAGRMFTPVRGGTL